MVLNMMIGIRMATTRATLESNRQIEPYDFLMKEKLSILPGLTGKTGDSFRRYNYVS